jgi:type I restriction enzyme, S subunit
MKWPPIKVETIKSPTRYSLIGGPFGSELTGKDYVDEGVPVIRGANLPDDRVFLDDDFVFVREEKADQLVSNMAYPGDVVFTQRGTLGQVGIIPTEALYPRYVVSQSQMKLTVDPGKAHAKFVYYYFRHPDSVQTIKNRALTSGVPHINLGILRDFELPLPPPSVQEEIVRVLSAYDDLIENNRRRMVLLEESGRLLYDEWFGRLRFPGHEHARIVTGLPEGWARKELESVCVVRDGIQTGPFGSQLHQSDYSKTGVPVVMPKDLISLRIDIEGVARIPESLADALSRHRMLTGDTVYGRRGDIGRRAFIGPKQAGWLCGTGCLRIRPDIGVVNPRFLFDTLGARDTAGLIANRAKGATMPNLNSTVLKSVPVLVPPRGLQDLYAEQVEPIAEHIGLLSEQNTKLKAARDLLLPRLLSGEITA